MKKASLAFALLLLVGGMPGAVGAQGPELAPGQLVKSRSSSAVYYIDEDLSRQVFPNGRIFASWYADFSGVVEVDDATLSEYPLTGNVPYKPAKRLVKIQTDPKVYAVDEGGTLRWVKTEAAARALYGDRWNQLVDDLSDAFFVDYLFGTDIDDSDEFDSKKGERLKDLLETLREKRLLKIKAHDKDDDDDDELENEGFGKDKAAVCHKGKHTIYVAKPALPAHLGHGDTQGRCGGGATDTTAPVILSASIGGIASTSAHVLFTTGEPVKAAIYSGTSSPVGTSGAATVNVTNSASSHDVTLTGLAAGTTYRVVIVVKDAAGNKTTSSELSFTTAAAPDTTAPIFLSSSIGSATTTSAHVLFTTNEPVTAVIHSGTTTPVDTSGAPDKVVAALGTAHDVELTGLTAGTTYRLLIVAKDAANNSATSTELVFTTATGS